MPRPALPSTPATPAAADERPNALDAPAAAPPSTTGRRSAQAKPARLRGHGPQAPGSMPPPDDTELALPHERDESVGTASTAQAGAGAAGHHQRTQGRQAAQDLAQGQVDTDLHATPGLDAARREALLGTGPSAPTAPPRRRR